jgi:hypothetical protein
MNIVVVIAPLLIASVDGRGRLELGVPPTSDVGDILDTLLRLYPKLINHMATDRKGGYAGMNVYWSQLPMLDAVKKSRLREGQTLFLCAAPGKRLAQS